MGQAHPKATAVELLPSPSTGPDPTISRPQHITHTSLPPLPDPPHSAAMAFGRTDETFTRLDYAPGPGGGGLPKPSRGFSGNPKNLARKLSLKARGQTSHGQQKSVGEKMRVFEGMVQAAEARVGLESPPGSGGGKTIKASTFSTAKGRRGSIAEVDSNIFDAPTSAPITTSAIPFPLDESKTSTISSRPTHHRRSASNSLKSGKVSMKSSKRAEREWRAKVAAMAYASSPHSSTIPLRGPVPPKRTPLQPKPDVSVDSIGSPLSDMVVTPPHGHPYGSGTPAKSFLVNTSFETLGHYESPIPIAKGDGGEVGRERKASVPYSVVSSFYFDPVGGSRVSTRPSSFAATQLLATVPADGASPLRHFTVVPDRRGDERDEEGDGEDGTTPTGSRPHEVSLPPFKSFQLSPVTVSSPIVALPPAAPESTTKSRQLYQGKRASAPANVDTKLTPLLPQPGVELRVNITKDENRRYHTLPTTRKSAPPPFDPSSLNTSSRSAGPSTKAVLVQSTPARGHAKKVSVPGTPLSPTTAFLMTAPMESIDVTGFMCAASPEQYRAHPYSMVPVVFASPDPPIPPTKIARPVDHAILAEPLSHRNDAGVTVQSFDPFIVSKSTKEKSTKKPSRIQSDRPKVLQPRRGQPKAMAVGQDPARVELERQRERLRKMGIDLTPGMVDGNRPPKSGLPKGDLERWLIHSSSG